MEHGIHESLEVKNAAIGTPGSWLNAEMSCIPRVGLGVGTGVVRCRCVALLWFKLSSRLKLKSIASLEKCVFPEAKRALFAKFRLRR